MGSGRARQGAARPDGSAGFEAFRLVGAHDKHEYDFLARLAAETFGTPMAGVTFITRDSQYFKASVGVPVKQTTRAESFCQYTVDSEGTLVVPDASTDDRFADSPLVTGEAGVRFYAGAPLRAEDGSVFGAVCVMDTQPRGASPEELDTLQGLARQATVLIERARDRRQIERLDRRLSSDEDLARVGAWEWNAQTNEGELTDKLAEILGFGVEEVRSMDAFLERVHQQDRKRVEAALNEAVERKRPFSYRARVVHPDGEVRTIDTQGEPQLDELGEVVGLRGATVDVTDLVEAEVRSREQAMGLYAAFDTALDPILIVDERRRYVHANRAAIELFGIEREELLGRELADLVGDRDRDDADRVWEAFLERGELQGEIELRRADGTPVLAQYSATANFVPDRHMVVLHDMTERLRNERAVREERRRLEETQALAKVGSWEWNLGSQLAISSAELLRILGRPPGTDPPTYEEFVEYVHPEDRESYDRVAAKALEDHQPFHQIFRVITESGEVRTVESHGRVEVNEDGEPVRMYGAAQDITERREAERELRVQAEILQRLPAGIIATGPDRLIRQWSRGAEELFGISSSFAAGRTVDDLDILAPDSVDQRREMVERLGAGKAWEGQLELKRADGTAFPAMLTNSPTRDGSGEIVGYIGIVIDLSDRRRVENELFVRGQLLDQVNAAVIALDPERRVTHWNAGAEQLSGLSSDEAIGRTLPEIGLVAEDAAQTVEARGRMVQGDTWEGEIEMRHKDGSTFPTLTSVSPARDSAGKLTGFVGVAVDITARKQAEEEARRARLETLKRLSRAVEKRDPETGGHIERIGEISAMLAERLGMPEDKVELIRVASPMHDVGKIGIPDEILLKPGKLTAQERAEMQRHTLIGRDILAGSLTELLDMASTIALTHHERVDGTGYPLGLAGDQIPIEGRIVAVADVFDALISDRVYRKAMEVDEAIEIMRAGRGTQFDARVLDILLSDVEAFLAVKRADPLSGYPGT